MPNSNTEHQSFYRKLKSAFIEFDSKMKLQAQMPVESEAFPEGWEDVLALSQDDEFKEAIGRFWEYKYYRPFVFGPSFFIPHSFLKWLANKEVDEPITEPPKKFLFNSDLKIVELPHNSIPTIKITIKHDVFTILYQAQIVRVVHQEGVTGPAKFAGSVEEFYEYLIEIITALRAQES